MPSPPFNLLAKFASKLNPFAKIRLENGHILYP
jgi:hypothetical protein